MVDEHGAAGNGATDTDAYGGRQQERQALDEIEAVLVDVAAALARMG